MKGPQSFNVNALEWKQHELIFSKYKTNSPPKRTDHSLKNYCYNFFSFKKFFFFYNLFHLIFIMNSVVYNVQNFLPDRRATRNWRLQS